MSYEKAVIIHKVLTELHIGMLFLATLGAVSASYFFRRARWEKVATISDGMFTGAALCGTAFLILSAITGFMAWPWDRLWRTPTVYSKVTFATLGFNFWTILIFLRLRYGVRVWEKGSLSTAVLIFTLLGSLAVLMAGSAGGHLGHGVSILDPVFSRLGIDPYIPIVLAPWWSMGIITAGSFLILWQWAKKEVTKLAYAVLILLFAATAGMTKLLWNSESPSHLAQTQHKGAGRRPKAIQLTLQPAEGASVKILSPKNGEAIKGDKIPVHFNLVKGKRGEHVHAYVDGELVGMFKSEKGTLTGVQPGHHSLEIRVLAEDHKTELDASDKVHFVVK